MLAKLLKVFPLQSRSYTDRNGQPQVFKTKPFLLQHETGSIYAEATQDLAQRLEDEKVEVGMCAFVSVTSVAREYKTAKDETRYANEHTITNLVLI